MTLETTERWIVNAVTRKADCWMGRAQNHLTKKSSVIHEKQIEPDPNSGFITCRLHSTSEKLLPPIDVVGIYWWAPHIPTAWRG